VVGGCWSRRLIYNSLRKIDALSWIEFNVKLQGLGKISKLEARLEKKGEDALVDMREGAGEITPGSAGWFIAWQNEVSDSDAEGAHTARERPSFIFASLCCTHYS